MTRDRCERTWQVEALEDGRLEEKDRASVERHVAACSTCARAQERFVALRDALRALPADKPSELERRRGRAELLSRANDAVVSPPAARRWGAVALVAAMAVAAVLLLVVKKSPWSSATVAVAPRYEVVDVAAAEYSARSEGGAAIVDLRSGTASFRVDRVAVGGRFVVRVPDGEVEVRGTRFVVQVAEGRTRSVAVTEGVVDVRVAGFTGVLRANESWPPASPAPVASDAATLPAPTATPPVPAATPPASVTLAVAPPPGPPPSPPGPPPTAPPSQRTSVPTPTTAAPAIRSAPSASAAAVAGTSAAPTDGPGARFASAMQSYRAGDYGEAEVRFAGFVRDYPGDARAEDAMFLIADGRARRGDDAGARSAARAYLQRYPDGLRAPAARRLASP